MQPNPYCYTSRTFPDWCVGILLRPAKADELIEMLFVGRAVLLKERGARRCHLRILSNNL